MRMAVPDYLDKSLFLDDPESEAAGPSNDNSTTAAPPVQQ